MVHMPCVPEVPALNACVGYAYGDRVKAHACACARLSLGLRPGRLTRCKGMWARGSFQLYLSTPSHRQIYHTRHAYTRTFFLL